MKDADDMRLPRWWTCAVCGLTLIGPMLGTRKITHWRTCGHPERRA